MMKTKPRRNFPLLKKCFALIIGIAVMIQLFGASLIISKDHVHKQQPPQSKRTAATPTNRAIFYNAFVNKDRYDQTLEIIQEQLSGILTSNFRNSTLFFNNWGKEVPDSTICPTGTHCQRIRYRESGTEQDTLQDLYEYCLQNPNHAVVYLHDKGSFNPSGNNNRVRRLATKSALSDACFTATSEQHHCSVCVSRFHLLPNYHTNGNMWTANCSYVRLLIPPKIFDDRRQEMFRHVRHNETLLNKIYCVKALVKNFEEGTEFGNDQWKFMSIFRYAMEHWVFSHPFLQICHTMPEKMGRVPLNSWKPTLTEGPGSASLAFERATKTGWYQLEGRKFEYQYLYHTQPKDDSFIWDVYKKSLILPRDRITC